MTIETIFPIILILAALFTTLVTGLLFGFAIVVMPGIKNLADRDFIRSFQEMDGIIQNNQPLFILVWLGSALLLLTSAIIGFRQVAGGERIILITATFIYILGVQLPTIAINVPLNNKLQMLNVDTMDPTAQATARSNFEPRWNQWNGIRTVFSALSSTLLNVLLFIL